MSADRHMACRRAAVRFRLMTHRVCLLQRGYLCPALARRPVLLMSRAMIHDPKTPIQNRAFRISAGICPTFGSVHFTSFLLCLRFSFLLISVVFVMVSITAKTYFSGFSHFFIYFFSCFSRTNRKNLNLA